MTRQFYRLTRIRLRTTAQKQCPPDFMVRLITAYAAHSWREYADASIVHDGSCGVRRGKSCTCTPDVFIAIPDGALVEVAHDRRVKRETRQ